MLDRSARRGDFSGIVGALSFCHQLSGLIFLRGGAEDGLSEAGADVGCRAKRGRGLGAELSQNTRVSFLRTRSGERRRGLWIEEDPWLSL